MRKDGAGAPTANRALSIVQGILRRAVEWRRIAANPAAQVPKLKHQRSGEIRGRLPDEVEAIRVRLERRDAAIVSVLAYVGVRPAEAFALRWRDVIDARGKPRARLWAEGTKTVGSRRNPEVPGTVGRELLELYLADGRPPLTALVFTATTGSEITRQNWRQRVWKTVLAGFPAGTPPAKQTDEHRRWPELPYFRPYDLRHTCATLMIYEGRTANEVARQLGHADPGFTLRTYTHIFDDAARHRGVTVDEAVRSARHDLKREKGAT